MGSKFVRKPMGNSRPAKRLFLRVWLTIYHAEGRSRYPQNTGPYAVTTQDTAILTVTTQITSNLTHTFFSLKSLPQ